MENTTETKLRLLVVEDEPFLRDLLAMKFSEEDIDLLQTSDGNEVVSLATTEKPNAILLDLVLPDISGFEILKSLKSNEVTKDIPVLILSNLGQDEDVKRGLSLGAAEFLIKAHTSPTAIISKVRAIIKKQT